jgi:hypothetical protein
MDAIRNQIADLVFSSPPPAPPPGIVEQQYIENVVFLGVVLCCLYLALVLIDSSEQEWEDIHFFQIIGACSVSASYFLGFAKYGYIQEEFHSVFMSVAIVCFSKHLAKLNELEPRLSNIMSTFTMVPAIFLITYKKNMFHLQSCSSMRMLLVLCSLIPFVLLLKTLRAVGYDREKRMLRFRLMGLYLLNLLFHTIVSPQHMCQARDAASATSVDLLFDASTLALAYT